MDESGKIDPNWMNRVKEVIDWTIESNMYCILNVHNDGILGNWLSKGLMSKNKYINLWKQIADKFQVYDEHLIFESMNEYEYNDTNILFNFTQIFVDTIRNSGGNNIYRLLLIPGIKSNIDLTCSLEYKIPKDPSNNLGISINYYVPGQFTIATEDKPFKYKILTGDVYELHDYKTWGTDSNYKEIATDFNTMKKAFIDKEIPVIISEVGVITEEKKNIISIREYLNFIFSLSAEYDGITSCLWDTSKKTAGNMNYFNRENNEWYDEKIKENFYKIYKGQNIKPLDYYINTNLETTNSLNIDGELRLKIENKKVLKVFINVNLNCKYYLDCMFGLVCQNNKNTNYILIAFEEKNGKRQYDGTFLFTRDISKENCSEFILTQVYLGKDLITFNNLTVEYEKNYLSFDYKSYKEAISNYI